MSGLVLRGPQYKLTIYQTGHPTWIQYDTIQYDTIQSNSIQQCTAKYYRGVTQGITNQYIHIPYCTAFHFDRMHSAVLQCNRTIRNTVLCHQTDKMCFQRNTHPEGIVPLRLQTHTTRTFVIIQWATPGVVSQRITALSGSKVERPLRTLRLTKHLPASSRSSPAMKSGGHPSSSAGAKATLVESSLRFCQTNQI